MEVLHAPSTPHSASARPTGATAQALGGRVRAGDDMQRARMHASWHGFSEVMAGAGDTLLNLLLGGRTTAGGLERYPGRRQSPA
jgi:hypothetical protein